MGGTACREASADNGIVRKVWQQLLPGRTSVRLAFASLLQVSLQSDSREKRICVAELMLTESDNMNSISLSPPEQGLGVEHPFIPFIPVKNLHASLSPFSFSLIQLLALYKKGSPVGFPSPPPRSRNF
jgi:hypothetical protein